MYEDALENAEEALKLQKDFRKSLIRKGTALAFLFEFEKSYSIFKKLKDKENIEMIRCVQEQALGIYEHFLTNPEKFLSQNCFANYINPKLVIKMTEDKGRGVFATESIK